MLEGIDVSHHNGKINWQAVAASGKAFMFAKCSEGGNIKDKDFRKNVAGAKSAGLVTGAYHFFRANVDGELQGRRLIDLAAPLVDLLAIDVETMDGQTRTRTIDELRKAVDIVKEASGRPPIIYTGFLWKRDFANSVDNLGCPLWLAQYGPKAVLPKAWTEWTFWQYSSSGKVPGIRGNVDLNRFDGAIEDLQKLSIHAKQTEPTPLDLMRTLYSTIDKGPTATMRPVKSALNAFSNHPDTQEWLKRYR